MELAVKRLSLIVHHLCPYAQRALYTVAYKGLSPEIIEVSLAEKPAILRANSILGKVPALIVETQHQSFSLSESKEVCEYLDSFPGPPLYPRQSSGSLCPLRKALIDMHTKLTIDPLPPLLFLLITGKATPADVQRTRKLLKIIDQRYVTNGGFFMHSVLKEDVVTICDVMLYPFAERIFAYQSTALHSVLEGGETTNLKLWFERMSALPWVKRFKADPGRLGKILEEYKEGRFKGLQLPLSRYD